jgi:hypothetical protein
MAALSSLMRELVNATIKYVVAPLEVGPEFGICPQLEIRRLDQMIR